jgi:hypothetical protein
MFKRWIPASFIAVAMALALAGGAVLAVGSNHGPRNSGVLGRAAEILGIEVTDLQDARAQAQREADDARISAIVTGLVDRGVIDQSEADSFTSWLADRPDVANEAMFSKLTSSIFGQSKSPMSSFELRISPLGGSFGGSMGGPIGRNAGITNRMAEILGIDPQSLADAMKDGASELNDLDHLERMHALIDDLLANEQITADEATDLHNWIDEAPEWLLNVDISSHMLPGLRLFSERLEGFDRPREFSLRDHFFGKGPFGRDLFGNGEGEFHFEYRGPEGSFSFGPNDGEFPFDDEQFKELFERLDLDRFEEFERFENFEDLDDILERFRGHRFFGPPVTEPTEVPETTATSA